MSQLITAIAHLSPPRVPGRRREVNPRAVEHARPLDELLSVYNTCYNVNLHLDVHCTGRPCHGVLAKKLKMKPYVLFKKLLIRVIGNQSKLSVCFIHKAGSTWFV